MQQRQQSRLPEGVAAVHQLITAALETTFEAHLSADHPPLGTHGQPGMKRLRKHARTVGRGGRAGGMLMGLRWLGIFRNFVAMETPANWCTSSLLPSDGIITACGDQSQLASNPMKTGGNNDLVLALKLNGEIATAGKILRVDERRVGTLERNLWTPQSCTPLTGLYLIRCTRLHHGNNSASCPSQPS